MKISTILVAVDDSPASLAAAELAAGLASALGATMHAVAVTPLPARAPGHRSPVPQSTGNGLLRYVGRIGERAHLTVVPAALSGQPALQVLAHAREVGADLIVVGRSARHRVGEPYVGSQTRHVLEFADCAVLVVPPPVPPPGSGSGPGASVS